MRRERTEGKVQLFCRQIKPNRKGSSLLAVAEQRRQRCAGSGLRM